MIVTFFTAIHKDEHRSLCFSKKAIAKEYLSGWFWIDLVSILPIDQIIKVATDR